jgi:hypothetical protein
MKMSLLVRLLNNHLPIGCTEPLMKNFLYRSTSSSRRKYSFELRRLKMEQKYRVSREEPRKGMIGIYLLLLIACESLVPTDVEYPKD